MNELEQTNMFIGWMGEALESEGDLLFGCSFRDSGGGVQKHRESDMLLSRLARSDGPDLPKLSFGGGMRNRGNASRLLNSRLSAKFSLPYRLPN